MPVEIVNDLQYEPYSVWRTPKLLETAGHGIAADVLSMCVSLATNSSVRVEEARCANAHGHGRRCLVSFSSSPLPASADGVRAAFVDAMLAEGRTWS